MTGSRRQAGGRRRASARGSGRVTSTVAGVALAAVAVTLQFLTLTPEEKAAPLASTGAVREEVATGRYSAKVESVTAATSIEVPDGNKNKVVDGEGLFLVVQASATVPAEPMHIDAEFAAADGRRFLTTDKVRGAHTLAEPWIQPGWWVKGVFVFEVPREAVAGGSVVVTPDRENVLIEPYPPAAVIDLGLDEKAAGDLVARAQHPYKLTRGN
ncbi:hypothetical protein DP939_04470 [Spongiactinospora rosea]|uniref:DUF4352 domain-containing protein n=1 Tax=Spongiactinospora rosea TaxID=2248750 RepID=A0A366M6R3_9ACTN|nr:hypothetical protein [Spongiactinospora rosea]RBQ21931.1 hypothetical protein DP939_04470 [Spongiactinospora rosea]